ncbi:HK97-gp10 family putative phage morphogenesis protein [Hymenobacter sp. BT491]|uniref:HK97-gp10 family putative phage morphogenesis protein n=1 Tax=Hymenobacter sp. BT491 TaxID=2766779 RepID=UPI0016539AD0|nr:HK97-gp10 family putative phage morphogenesis protein [Hymenobacter sp. BT491]MBC6988936.1 HK97 gp10 family phage protein [Hymenobacter sp. BT491]
MVSIQIKPVDTKKALGLLARFRTDATQRVRDVVASTALQIESDAKQLAPVDTGRLRASIHADINPDGLGATVGSNVTYSVFIELGTRTMRAQPFLFPAYEMNRQRFLANLKEAVRFRL